MIEKRYIVTMKTNFDKSRNIKEKVLNFIQVNKMISCGDKLLIGLSGGADSVCLFSLLLDLRDSLGFTLEAIHINHMIRETADRDENFVKEICKQNQIKLYIERIDVHGLVKEGKMSLEEAGRKARYEAFSAIGRQNRITKIAVAHHENDQAETILFHLCRGTGVEGLCGIRPVRGNIIRPLLCLSRFEIEEYVQNMGLSFVTDETNAENTYSRNYLRNQIIPQLDSNICHDTVKHMAKAAELTQEAFSYLSLQISEAYDSCVTYDMGYCGKYNTEQDNPVQDNTVQNKQLVLQLEIFSSLHPYLQNEVLRRCLFQIAGSKKDISGVHIEAIQKLALQQVGSLLNLPYQIVAERSYNKIIFDKNQIRISNHNSTVNQNLKNILNTKENKINSEIILISDSLEEHFEDKFKLPDGKTLTLRVFPYEKDRKVPIKAYTKWFDYDRIVTPLVLRTPKEGDFFYFNDKNRKFVKDYMVNEKIPAKERESCLLIALGSHMLYFIGRRISNFYKVTENTKQILEISIQEDE